MEIEYADALVTAEGDMVTFSDDATVTREDGGFRVTRPDGCYIFSPDWTRAQFGPHGEVPLVLLIEAFYEDQASGGNRRSWSVDDLRASIA